MANYAALKSYLDTNNGTWTGDTNAAVVSWLEEKALPGTISAGEIRSVVLQTGEWGNVELAAQNTNNPDDLRGACMTAIALLRDRDAVVDYSDSNETSSLSTMTQTFVDAGLIQASTKSAIDSLGLNIRSRLSESGFGGSVTEDDIQRIR